MCCGQGVRLVIVIFKFLIQSLKNKLTLCTYIQLQLPIKLINKNHTIKIYSFWTKPKHKWMNERLHSALKHTTHGTVHIQITSKFSSFSTSTSLCPISLSIFHARNVFCFHLFSLFFISNNSTHNKNSNTENVPFSRLSQFKVSTTHVLHSSESVVLYTNKQSQSTFPRNDPRSQKWK